MHVIESSTNATVRHRIRVRMYETDVTPIELSDRTGLSRHIIYTRLRGVGPFTMDEIELIANALDMDVRDVF